MTDPVLQKLFSRARIDDRQVNELIGLARGIVADNRVTQEEAETLQNWLTANTAVSDNPVIAILLQRVNAMLADDILDDEEASELLQTLQSFAGGHVELGELLKSSQLPLDDPPPRIVIPSRRFCFTGTFAFGTRRDCENAVRQRDGIPGKLTRDTDYLIVGLYATDSWAHSTFGRKIEKAAAWRDQGNQLAIVSELDWVRHLD